MKQSGDKPRNVLGVIAVALVAVMVQLGSVLVDPVGIAVGGASTEAPGHFWGLWTTLGGLAEHGPWWRSAPEIGWPRGFEGHLIDPTSLLVFAPVAVLGDVGAAVLGWNLLVALASVVAAVGGARLVRVVLGDVDLGVSVFAAAATAFTAYSLAFPWLGRTEYLTLALLPLQVSLLWQAAHSPGLRWCWALASGVTLGLVGANVGYGGLFAAFVNGGVAGLLLWRAPNRRICVGVLVVVAGVGLLMSTPSVVALLADPSVRQKMRPMAQRLLGGEVCALFRACAPTGLQYRLDSPVYVGWVLPLVAFWGAWRSHSRSLPWLGLAAVALVLSLGPGPYNARPAGWLVKLVPALRSVQDWSRLAAVVPMLLVVPAALGLKEAPRWLALALAALLCVDTSTYPRNRMALEIPSFSPAPSSDLLEVLDQLPPGPIVTLPVEGRTASVDAHEVGFHALWAHTHGRPVSARPDSFSDVTLSRSGLVQRTTQVAAALLEPVTVELRDCMAGDVSMLAERGFVALVLVDPAAHKEMSSWLSQVLGPPTVARPDAHGWSLSSSAAAAPCRVGALHTGPPSPRRSHHRMPH